MLCWVNYTVYIIIRPLVKNFLQCIICLIQNKLCRTVKVSQFYFGINLPSFVLRNTIQKFEQKFILQTELLRAFS